MSSAIKKTLLLFGAPGSGKGTYGNLLIRDTGFMSISMGDEIRKLLNGKETSSSLKDVAKQVQQGKLIDDDLVFEILEGKLREKESSHKGIILDGFPRTFSQMERFIRRYTIDLVINCILDEEILVEKLLGRRTCVSCGKGYNFCTILKRGYDMPAILPKNSEGKCDSCSGNLVSRIDDTEEIIRKRLKEYSAKTEGLLDFFRKKEIVIDFSPKRGVADYPDFFTQMIKPRL